MRMCIIPSSANRINRARNECHRWNGRVRKSMNAQHTRRRTMAEWVGQVVFRKSMVWSFRSLFILTNSNVISDQWRISTWIDKFLFGILNLCKYTSDSLTRRNWPSILSIVHRREEGTRFDSMIKSLRSFFHHNSDRWRSHDSFQDFRE